MPVTQGDKRKLIHMALESGADHASFAQVRLLTFREEFRRICEKNSCGMYGRCWTCPPDAGEIGYLIAELRTYREALVYQTISKIEDSFDIEGMLRAGDRHNRISQRVAGAVVPATGGKTLHLTAGGCHVCKVCAKAVNKPCRFPDRAMASLEAYGVDVAELAAACGLSYNNGINTVTYFGAFFIK